MNYEKSFELFEKSVDVQRGMEWMRWVDEIPFIAWPPDWEVKAIPPFGGAVARYRVRRTGAEEGRDVSIYLDCYDILGSVGEPYWEVYPGTEEGDPARCLMMETNDLLEHISVGLEHLELP